MRAAWIVVRHSIDQHIRIEESLSGHWPLLDQKQIREAKDVAVCVDERAREVCFDRGSLRTPLTSNSNLDLVAFFEIERVNYSRGQPHCQTIAPSTRYLHRSPLTYIPIIFKSTEMVAGVRFELTTFGL